MRAILEKAGAVGMLSYSQAAACGANGRTLDALVRRGLLIKTRLANGNYWELSEAERDRLTKDTRP